MKFKHLLMAAFAAVAMVFTSCEKEEDLGAAQVTVDPTTLTFEASASSQSVSLTATRDWTATTPEWIALSATSGTASSKAQTISVTVEENTGNNRSGEVVFTIGLAKAVLTVNQAGPGGEIQVGDGSLENPYSVAGVRAYVESLGADVQSSNKVYVKGIISAVGTTFEASGDYGNATFDMVDNAGDTETFKAFQTYYLGNRKWKSGDTEVKVGDEVIVYGPVVNYKGNTPETAGKGASFIYSLNGVTEGGGGSTDPGTAKGDGSLDNPYNPAGAAAYAQSLGADVQSDKSVYIKGKISNVSTTYEASGTYGNATFTIVDEADGTGEFYVFQTYYLGNRKWKSGDTDVKVGDVVIVYGPVVNYKGNTPETVGKGASYVYSLNGVTDGGEGGGDTTTDSPSGSGTLDDPYNPKAAYDVAAALESGAKTESDVYIKGKISSIKYTFSAEYGTATFDISEDGSTTGKTQLPVYSVYYLGNRAWTNGDTQVAVGDEVIICGKLTNYQGNTPETASKEAYIYSLNGVTDGGDPMGTINLTAFSNTADGITASWEAFDGADTYAWMVLYLDETADDGYGYAGYGFVEATSIESSYSSHSDEDMWFIESFAEGTTYYFAVMAYDAEYNVIAESELKSFTYSASTADSDSVTWSKEQLAAAACKGASNAMNDVISFTNSSDYGTTTVTELRVYKSQTLTFTAADGYVITGIEFTCTANGTTKQGPGCWGAGAPEGYTFDASGKTGVWSGSASSVAFTATDNQVRVAELKVYYKAQ